MSVCGIRTVCICACICVLKSQQEHERQRERARKRDRKSMREGQRDDDDCIIVGYTLPSISKIQEQL